MFSEIHPCIIDSCRNKKELINKIWANIFAISLCYNIKLKIYVMHDYYYFDNYSFLNISRHTNIDKVEKMQEELMGEGLSCKLGDGLRVPMKSTYYKGNAKDIMDGIRKIVTDKSFNLSENKIITMSLDAENGFVLYGETE